MTPLQAQRPSRLGHIVVRRVQLRQNRLALEPVDASGQRSRCRLRPHGRWRQRRANRLLVHFFVRQEQQPFHRVAQLANVAGPRMLFQRRDRRRRERFGFPSVELRDTLRKMSDQYRYIALAIPQRRQHDREHVDAMVQVLPELPLRHQLFQIAMSRHYHAHVHAHWSRSANALHLALFQNPQQLGLHDGRHVADLIQKQRPAMRLLELPAVTRRCPSERSLLVPEQLALDQLARHRRAVQRDERFFAPRAAVVNRTRDQFLARSRLA